MIAKGSAQSVQLKGGDSTLYNGYGASADAYLRRHQINFSGGVQQGSLQFGISDRFSFRGMTFIAGDSSFNYSTDGSGLGVAVRGINVTRKNLSVFTGAVGVQTMLPYFSTLRPQHFGVGLYFCKRHNRLEFRSLDVLAGSKKTFLQSIKYVGHYFAGSTSVGWNQGQFQWTGFGSLSTEHFAVMANRVQQSFQNQQTTSNSLAATFHVTRFSVSAAIVQANYAGTTTTGKTASAVLRTVDWLSVGASLYESGSQKVVQANVQQTGRVLSTSFAVDNQKHYGGSMTLNTHRFNVSVGRSEVLIPHRGWVSSTVFSISGKFRDLAVTVSRIFLPDGSKKLTINGSDWVYRDRVQENEPKFSKYILEGKVVDEAGLPVAGVAVKLGKIVCFSDQQGEFYLRVKHNKSYSVEVLTDDFMLAGKIRVVSAQPQISPGSAVQVVVARM